jgi:hypothetical protein
MGTMRAVVYEKPFVVSVHQVPKPKILHPDDIIVKGAYATYNLSLNFLISFIIKKPILRLHQPVTTTCICGSDLHMYEGRTAAEAGIVFGHENMGIVDVSFFSYFLVSESFLPVDCNHRKLGLV